MNEKITVTDTNGCTATATTTVALFEPPSPQISMTPKECKVTLHATPPGFVSYEWSNGLGNTPDVDVYAPGTYTVTVIDANGCAGTAFHNVTIEDIEPTDFSGIYLVGNPANNIPGVQQDANGNELWDGLNVRFAGTLVVPANRTLHIRNTDVQMIGQTTKIEVERGAILIINDNAVLRADNCHNDFWQGIQAFGTPNLPHQIDPLAADPYTMTDPNAGVVYVDNATIMQAKIAFANAPVDFSMQPISHIYANTGGMIIAQNAHFENNEIGLYFFAFKPRNYSLVRACRFEANALFPGNFDIFDEQIGIVQMRGFFQYPILENVFINNLQNEIHKRGIGILNNEAATQIGLPEQGNTFENLFKGIDYMGGPSIASQIYVQGNYFIATHKSLTLTGGIFAGVNANNFWYIANGQNPDLSVEGTAYGILTDGATGLVIRNNTFNCNQLGAANPQNIGLIVRNSGNYANMVTDNYFGGSFGFANRYTGKNRFISVDCNIYENTVHTDWKVDGNFADQGYCFIFEPEYARRNTFHTPIAGINGLNIDATEVVAPFNYVPQPGFEPLSVSAIGINVFSCLFPDVPPTHCSLNPEECDPDCFAGRIQGASGENELVAAYTGLLQKRIALEQFEAAKQDLIAEQRDAALKALIATYAKEGNADSAWVKLNQLPLNNDENITFYNLYSEILQGIQPPAGSGKTMSIQEQMIRTTATHTNNAVAAQAEVVMNAYYNSLFNKNVNGVLLKGAPAQQPALWSLLPNPTKQQQVTLNIKQGLLAGHNRADVSIYNFNGALLRQVKGLKNNETISVADLPTGIYICVLHIGSQYIGSQKLVVLP